MASQRTWYAWPNFIVIVTVSAVSVLVEYLRHLFGTGVDGCRINLGYLFTSKQALWQ
ncbi:protein of unknown function (plasmid) [Legionella fallonii LLAP-10]|uniref:Uncharacterized protein n=1 Tax=Legionella fallonii LLAP-10 TaxID=1212491 RepID=A0A098G9L4_9GAMM|nr:protein of unknown function [Legionella fallonii LLAP-10]